MGEDQDAVAQQLPAIGTAQIVEASHLLSCEASTGGEDQQDGVDAVLRHGHSSAEFAVHFRLACCCIKQACKKDVERVIGENAAVRHIECKWAVQRGHAQGSSKGVLFWGRRSCRCGVKSFMTLWV